MKPSAPSLIFRRVAGRVGGATKGRTRPGLEKGVAQC
jgi:hypothetical protein